MFVKIIVNLCFCLRYSCVTPCVTPLLLLGVIVAVLLLEVSHGSRVFVHCSTIGPIIGVSGCGAFFAIQTRLRHPLNARHRLFVSRVTNSYLPVALSPLHTVCTGWLFYRPCVILRIPVLTVVLFFLSAACLLFILRGVRTSHSTVSLPRGHSRGGMLA